MNNQRDKVTFETNVPVTVTLQYPTGKIVSGRFGEQVMYGLAGNRVMFLDLAIAQKINMLEPQAGESVAICKRNAKVWDVWLTPETERMRSAKDQGSMEQRLRASVTEACETRYAMSPPKAPTPINTGASALTPAPATTTSTPSGNAGKAPSREPTNDSHRTASPLVEEANAVVDAYAIVLNRALTTYEGRIKPDEIRSILLSVYIQQGKAAKYAAA